MVPSCFQVKVLVKGYIRVSGHSGTQQFHFGTPNQQKHGQVVKNNGSLWNTNITQTPFVRVTLEFIYT